MPNPTTNPLPSICPHFDKGPGRAGEIAQLVRARRTAATVPRDELSLLWAQMTHVLLGPEVGLPGWAGPADRLWDPEPAAPIDYEP